MKYIKIIKLITSFILISACLSKKSSTQLPNFIIFIADDISWDDFGCYGNLNVKTPNIDILSKDGLIFNNMYLTTSSCSPSRNSILTGRYPHNTGAPELHSEPPSNMITMVKELNDNGYYTVSSGKFHIGDYARNGFNLIHEKRDETGIGGEKKWVETILKRPKNKPFFMWYASHDAHRSWGENEFSGIHNPEEIIPPEYLIDDLATRQDLANYYDEIARFDDAIGKVIKTLKDEKIYDNTFIIIMADNGRPFPHSKTRLNNQGVKSPFITIFKRDKIIGKTNSLVSAIDIAPTILEYAGIKIGDNYQGKSFKNLLENPKNPFRNYVFAEHNWHDFEAHQRMVRSVDFMYIENNRNKFPQTGPLDAINSDSYASLIEKLNSGEISDIQKDIFLSPRSKEEFYKIKNDLYQRNNLIDDISYIENINTLRQILNKWKEETGDTSPKDITKDWYERRPGPKNLKTNSKKDLPIGGEYSLTTESHGKRGEFAGASKNATEINEKGPF